MVPMQKAPKTPSLANQDEDVSPGDDEPADDSDEPETLEDYLGTDFFSFDPEEQAANLARQEQQVQELIAECMTREGFEYIPVITRPFDDFGFGAPGDVEFAADFGFGITTFYGETETPWFQDDWIDPNQAIIEGLSESERNAYYDTLHGSSFSSGGFGFETDSATATSEDGSESEEVVVDSGFEGCSGQAFEEVYAFDELQEVYEQLDLSSLYERVEADPRNRENLRRMVRMHG